MENRNIIIILFAVIIILAAALGLMLMQPKEPTSIQIRQTELNVDDNLFSVNVTDSKGNLIPDVEVNMIIKDDKGNLIEDNEIPLESENSTVFDFDLKKGKYMVEVTYKGNKNYSESHINYNMDIEKVTPTYAADEIIAMDYPEDSPVFGHYKVIERQNELALIETSSGQSFVLAGDGYYTYGGHDSQGYIQLGSYVGKY